jgi:CBS domain-containing protein
MTVTLIEGRTGDSKHHDAATESTGSYLDSVEAREIMTPGVVTIVEDSDLRNAFRAMAAHDVHAVLVVARDQGKLLGWVTGRGLLTKLEDDASLATVRDAITERAVSIRPGATAREALAFISQADVSHLLVSEAEGLQPEGVVTELDLVHLAAA